MIDGRPADSASVANPGFAVRGDAGEERQLAKAAVGLRPIPLPNLFKSTQVERIANSVDAVRVALGIDARQQVSATRAAGQRRQLRRCIASNQQSKAQQRAFQRSFHYQFRVWDGLSFLLLIVQDKSRAGLFMLLYYNINNN